MRAATFDPAVHGCAECPRNLLLIVDVPGVAAATAGAATILASMSCAILVVCIADRVISASRAERQLIILVLASSAVAVGSMGMGLGFALVAGIAAFGRAGALTAVVAGALAGLAIAVSWEIVRIGTARRRSARLVSELSTAARPGRLREELAAITHDESLDLVFPLGDRVVDTMGRMTPDPRAVDGDRTRRVTVAMGRDGGEVALLTHRPGLLDDSGFRDAVARAAGLALEHERLQAELASRVSDLRESRARLVASSDSERRRLERDPHDGAQQQVVALLLELRMANSRHPRSALDEAIVEVGAALDELRSLAHGIFPAALSEDGLGAALDQLREGAEIPVRLNLRADKRWPGPTETTAYVIVAETLRNHRTKPADVDLTESDGMLRVTVSGTRDGPASSPVFAGEIAGLTDRVGAIGGRLLVEGDDGTLTVRAELPCVS